MSFPIRVVPVFAAVFVPLALPLLALPAQGQEVKIDHYYELETKYLFGFTNGTDIGGEGEKEFEAETTAAFQKRGGRYSEIEQEFEFEQVPSQFWGYELSIHGLSQHFDGVQGVDNFNQTNFSGLSWTPKWLIIGRGPGNPIGLSLSVQPEWESFAGANGVHNTTFSMETRLAADTELIPNMLYAAINLIYAPEVGQSTGDTGWERAAGYGASAALAYRIAPKVTIGGELEYYRSHSSFGLGNFDGAALYAGPTLHIQFNPKIFLAVAWSTQFAGHASGDPGQFDLTNFERQHGNLKLGFEF